MPVQRAQNIGRGVRQEPAPRDRTLGQEPIGYKDWSRASGRGDKVITLGDYGGHSFVERGRVDRIRVALWKDQYANMDKLWDGETGNIEVRPASRQAWHRKGTQTCQCQPQQAPRLPQKVAYFECSE